MQQGMLEDGIRLFATYSIPLGLTAPLPHWKRHKASCRPNVAREAEDAQVAENI